MTTGVHDISVYAGDFIVDWPLLNKTLSGLSGDNCSTRLQADLRQSDLVQPCWVIWMNSEPST